MLSTRPDGALLGLRILLVEDEFPVLLLIEDMLGELGCKIADTASSVEEALDRFGRREIDAAVLDINLRGEKIYPVADLLKLNDVPIVFSTGYGLAGIDSAWAHYPVVQKPFEIWQLAAALLQAIGT